MADTCVHVNVERVRRQIASELDCSVTDPEVAYWLDRLGFRLVEGEWTAVATEAGPSTSLSDPAIAAPVGQA